MWPQRQWTFTDRASSCTYVSQIREWAHGKKIQQDQLLLFGRAADQPTGEVLPLHQVVLSSSSSRQPASQPLMPQCCPTCAVPHSPCPFGTQDKAGTGSIHLQMSPAPMNCKRSKGFSAMLRSLPDFPEDGFVVALWEYCFWLKNKSALWCNLCSAIAKSTCSEIRIRSLSFSSPKTSVDSFKT